jgi:hypothetical protein
MVRRIAAFRLSIPDRVVLQRWVRAPTTAQRVVTRSRIILLLADGYSGRQVAAMLGLSRHTVDLWRQRFHEGGCRLLSCDRPGRGRKRGRCAPPRATDVPEPA